MNKDWTKIDFSPGIITWIENNKQEDMLQVLYPDNYILDMGWYEKIFRIYIIHDNDWVNPVFSYSVDNEDDLAEALSDCKERIMRIWYEMAWWKWYWYHTVYGGKMMLVWIMKDEIKLQGLKGLLFTKDAHGLYLKYGFENSNRCMCKFTVNE